MAAPCILPLLPIIIGGSVARDQKATWYRPLVVSLSLSVSVIVFSLLLKASTVLLGVPTVFWRFASALIIMIFGLNLLLPKVWEKLSAKLYSRSSTLLNKSSSRKTLSGDVMLGLALGPVFNSCSPTYALIVAAILPNNFSEGLLYLSAYSVGLSGMLLLVAYVGQTLVKKLGWLANPEGWFKKMIGVIFIIVALTILFGLDKKIQAYVLDRGWYDPVSRLEKSLDN